MNAYTVYNIVLAVLLLPLSYLLLVRADHDFKSFLLAARVAVMVALVSYPWDFFAIQLGVWRYPHDPGASLYGVPVNDLFFIWTCTLFTSSVLLTLRNRKPRRDCHAKSEHACEEHAGN